MARAGMCDGTCRYSRRDRDTTMTVVSEPGKIRPSLSRMTQARKLERKHHVFAFFSDQTLPLQHRAILEFTRALWGTL